MTVEKVELKPFSNEDQIKHKRYLDDLKQMFLQASSDPVSFDKSPEDFDKLKCLGSGAFGVVYLVRDKNTLCLHAMKAIEKEEVVKKKSVKQIAMEKKVLQSISFPFVLNLDYSCKDNVYVYLVLPFQSGGELFALLKKSGTFPEPLAKFYAAQVVLAVEYLHNCSVVHRDIKPENIFINASGYIKLGDLGFCKILKSRTWTLLGTPEYLAPEIIMSKGYSYPVDWWSTGILIFEMNSGYPPFYSSEPMKLYEKILSGVFKCPVDMNAYCKHLVKHLIEVDSKKRYGGLKSGVFEIKSHTWFHDVNWHAILHQNVEPPYVPKAGDLDAADFMHMSERKLKTRSQCLYEKVFDFF